MEVSDSEFVDLVRNLLKNSDEREHFFQVSVTVFFFRQNIRCMEWSKMVCFQLIFYSVSVSLFHFSSLNVFFFSLDVEWVVPSLITFLISCFSFNTIATFVGSFASCISFTHFENVENLTILEPDWAWSRICLMLITVIVGSIWE